MSQINVNTILPFSGNFVSANGVTIKRTSNTIQIGNATSAVTASDSTFIGSASGHSATGANNTCVGVQSGLSLTSGYDNVLIGTSTGGQLSTGYMNTIVGSSTGNLVTGYGNTLVGKNAGGSLTTGERNVFIGMQSGSLYPTNTSSNVIVIGWGANQSSSSVSNEITLGGSTIGALRCAVTSITSLSDARDKKDITDLRAGLDFVKSLRPVEFVWNDREEYGKHDVADFGFIAQDLKAAQEDAQMADILKLVYESNPEKLEASYGKLVPILVKAVQELAAKVEQLESK